jgi:thiol:disulfide interchange protein
MNPLRSAILIVIVLLFGADFGVWYYKTYGGDRPTVDSKWGDWDFPKPTPVQPTPPNAIQPIQAQPVLTVPRTYGQALAAARVVNKPLLLFFTSADCDYCTRMKQDTLSQPQVQQALQSYLVYTLDVQGPDAYVAASCNIRVVPYYLIVNAETRGVVKAGSGYKGAAVFLAWLNQ